MTPETHVVQLWRCSDCSTGRIWGGGHFPNREYQPLLRCGRCGEPTRHAFAKAMAMVWREFRTEE